MFPELLVDLVDQPIDRTANVMLTCLL
jgi:hypothetical protein